MGLPTIYWYPDPSGSVETYTFLENLTDLQVQPIRETYDAVTLSGGLYRSHAAARQQVRIVLENFTSEAFYLKMQSLSAHLERGGSIGFSLDHDRTWGAFLSSAFTAERGDTQLGVQHILTTTGAMSPNYFRPWSNSAALGADDYVCINNANPEGFREYKNITSISNTSFTVTLDEGLLYTYGSMPVLIRWRDFWPALKLRSDLTTPMLTTNHRLSYTLDMVLEEDWDAIYSMSVGTPLRVDAIEAQGASMKQLEDGIRRRTTAEEIGLTTGTTWYGPS